MKLKNRVPTYTLILFVPLLFFACSENTKHAQMDSSHADTAQKTDTAIKLKEDTIVARILKPYGSLKYFFTDPKEWLKENKSDSHKLNIVTAINRTDATYLARMDSILVPENFSYNLKFYMPFPIQAKVLQGVKKMVLFSYPAQVFAAYVNGELLFTGPTNMGRKNKPTPTGLYFTNWKAEHTISTVNDEWDLYWNFNIANRQGIGWHQYALPGYPASHSCLRLREEDARYLYSWADQWKLINNETIGVKGTPVIVFGKFDFDGEKPWLPLANDPATLAITESDMEDIVNPYLSEIMQEQARRDSLTQMSNLVQGN